MTWTYESGTDMFARDNPRFAANRPQRIRRHNLPCTDGDLAAGVMGTKHGWESWGIATVTTGPSGARDVEMFVCMNPECMRAKYGKTICKN